MLRVASLSFVLVARLTVLAAQPHPSLPSETVPDGLGVNIHFVDAQPGELDMLAAWRFPLDPDGFQLGRNRKGAWAI